MTAHSIQRIHIGLEPVGFGALKGAPIVPVTAYSRTVTGVVAVFHYPTPSVQVTLRYPSARLIWAQARPPVRHLPRKMLKGTSR